MIHLKFMILFFSLFSLALNTNAQSIDSKLIITSPKKSTLKCVFEPLQTITLNINNPKVVLLENFKFEEFDFPYSKFSFKLSVLDNQKYNSFKLEKNQFCHTLTNINFQIIIENTIFLSEEINNRSCIFNFVKTMEKDYLDSLKNFFLSNSTTIKENLYPKNMNQSIYINNQEDPKAVALIIKKHISSILPDFTNYLGQEYTKFYLQNANLTLDQVFDCDQEIVDIYSVSNDAQKIRIRQILSKSTHPNQTIIQQKIDYLDKNKINLSKLPHKNQQIQNNSDNKNKPLQIFK